MVAPEAYILVIARLASSGGSNPSRGTKFMMITATIKTVEQVGPDDWHTSRYSKNFSGSDTVQDILNWGTSLGFDNITINSFTFSEYIDNENSF